MSGPARPPGTDVLAGVRTRTVLVFLLLLGLFNGLYQVEKRYSGAFLDQPYNRLVTTAAVVLGRGLLPFEVRLGEGGALVAGHTTVLVRGGCNGLEAIFLLLAGVLAYPALWSRRSRALALYLPLLFLLNLLRVLMLLYVAAAHPAEIGFFHDQVGQGIMVVCVMALWVHHVHRAST